MRQQCRNSNLSFSNSTFEVFYSSFFSSFFFFFFKPDEFSNNFLVWVLFSSFASILA